MKNLFDFETKHTRSNTNLFRVTQNYIQWNLSFGTPLFKGHLHLGDPKFGPETWAWPPFRGHLGTQHVTDHKQGWNL